MQAALSDLLVMTSWTSEEYLIDEEKRLEVLKSQVAQTVVSTLKMETIKVFQPAFKKQELNPFLINGATNLALLIL